MGYSGARRLTFGRAGLVGPALEGLLARADTPGHLARDPLELVHLQRTDADRELVGLLASAVAYGRVDLFKPRLRAWLSSVGPRPAMVLGGASPSEVRAACASFSYRMTGPKELAALVWAGVSLQRRFGSIGAAVASCAEGSSGQRETLARFVNLLWDVDLVPFTGKRAPTRRLLHLVASPARGSACKRLNLYLRWMVRGPDGIDLGIWNLPTRDLVIPLDTHVHRLAGLLGLTRRKDLSWKTAEEVTGRLRVLDPEDPVRFDFALSHLGISGGCVSRRIDAVCGPCPLKPVCRVWDVRGGRAAPTVASTRSK